MIYNKKVNIIPLVLKVHHPCISHEMYKPWVILKEFAYTFMALHVSCLDITLNSFWTWNFEVGMSGHEKVNELMVRENAWCVITFSYPLHNVGTDVHESKTGICNSCVLTGTQSLSVHNEDMFLPVVIGESSGDVTAVVDTSLSFYSCVDSILPKAVECMVMDIGS